MSKIEGVFGQLKEGWKSVDDLCRELNWKPVTLRGAISVYARKNTLKVERKRIDKVTSYRVVAAE